jgi:hypothetical protein
MLFVSPSFDKKITQFLSDDPQLPILSVVWLGLIPFPAAEVGM